MLPADSYPLALTTWDQAEYSAIDRVVQSGVFTMGSEVSAFERRFADYIGTRHALMVNSGSSANLLLLAALRYHSRWGWGDDGGEVIVPAVSWGTTYYPVTQHGLDLVFVDVDPTDWNIDVAAVAEAITPRTRGVFAVSLLGAGADFAALRALCDEHDIFLIEDNCESLGAVVDDRLTGGHGLAGTHSGFFSHHICTMEGGLITTDDDELRDLCFSMRAHGWLRGLAAENHVHPLTGDSFLDSFTFALPGYNLRPLEMSGALGQSQLDKLPTMLEMRRENAARFVELLGRYPQLERQHPRGDSSWFGFGILTEAPEVRARLVAELGQRKIECRPVVAGNFTRNPVMRHLPHWISGSLTTADRLHDAGLFVGNHHVSMESQLDLLDGALGAVFGSG